MTPALTDIFTYADYLDMGRLFFDRKEYAKAEVIFQAAIITDGTKPHAFVNQSQAQREQGFLTAAVACAREAIQVDPTCAPAYHARSKAYDSLADFTAEEADLQQCLALEPDDPRWLCALAYFYITMGRFREALALYEKVVALNPYDWHSRFSVTTTKVALGDWSPETLMGYDIRHFLGAQIVPQNGKPLWQGQDLAGKRILVCGEQGLGDLVMFIRYARLLKERGATVYVRTLPEWADLAWRFRDVAEVFSDDAKLPDYDFHVSMLTCWRLLGTYDGDGAYLDLLAPKEFPHEMPTVGLCWRGQPKHQNDRFRSIFLDKPLDFTGIDALPFSLAKGDNGIETPTKLAQAINACDLIITVDTAIAHIAGALNRPVWMLLPVGCDYRWLLTGDTTPWYPRMKLYRCQKPLDWQPVLDRVREDVIQWREGWK